MTTTEQKAPSHQDSDDLIWGSRAIAAAINRTNRQAIYLLQEGRLPAKRVGKLWVARKSALQDFLSAV
jgi:hypothetical protein